MKRHIEGFVNNVERQARGLVFGEIATVMALLRQHREEDKENKIHWPLAVALVVEYLRKEYGVTDITPSSFLDIINKAEEKLRR